MKLHEIRKLIREEVSNVLIESTTKKILGLDFNVEPAAAGMKFVFKNTDKFYKSGISINALVDEITKMLDNKFGKGTFTFKPAGRRPSDMEVPALEFRMNANNFFKGL
jgi:hypothetical protein